MASTTVKINTPEVLAPTLAVLTITEAGQVAPDAAGYAMALGAEGNAYTITVTEACVGIYRIEVQNGDGTTVDMQYVWIEADDTAVYVASYDYNTARLRKDQDTRLDTIDTNLATANANIVIVDTVVDTILADTNELQTDWVNGGRLDLILDAINAKTTLIGTGAAVVVVPVDDDGALERLIIGDDYLNANGRALVWSFDAITGFTAETATGKFGIKNPDDGTEVYLNTSGVTADLGGGVWSVRFDVPRTALATLTPGDYDWSVEITQGGTEITVAKNHQNKTRVAVVEKQT